LIPEGIKMGYTIPVDICIICNKPMSAFSQLLSKGNGWACTLCSSCEEEILDAYGRDTLENLMGTGGLVDQIRNRLDSMTDPEDIKEAIYDLVVRFVEDVGGEENQQILDGIFDTLS